MAGALELPGRNSWGRGFFGSSVVKNVPANAGTRVQSLSGKSPPATEEDRASQVPELLGLCSGNRGPRLLSPHNLQPAPEQQKPRKEKPEWPPRQGSLPPQKPTWQGRSFRSRKTRNSWG